MPDNVTKMGDTHHWEQSSNVGAAFVLIGYAVAFYAAVAVLFIWAWKRA